MRDSTPDSVLTYARPARRQYNNAWIALGLFILAIAPFARTLENDFINFDDPGYVTENSHVLGGLTAENIAWAFTDLKFQSNWHPLTWMSHMLDVELFGLNPAGHHLTSVLLHAGNVVLVFILLRHMTRRTWPSTAVAALFAVHPTHVESVAWISERKDVLSAFFGLLALLAYAAYVRRPSINRYLMIVALFICGLLAKPMLVTLPLVMLLLDVWPLQRNDRTTAMKRSVEKVPLLLLAIGAGIVALIAQRAGGSVGTLDKYPLMLRLENAVVSYGKYLLKTIWPVDLAIFYPYPRTLSIWTAILSGGLLLALTMIVLLQLRKRPWFAVGWFWFLVMLVPVVGLVQIGRQSMADRYLYLPQIGLFIAIVWFVSEKQRVARVAGWVSCAIVIVLAALTWRQTGFWKNSTMLFSHALSVTQDNVLAHHQLANEFARMDNLARAEEHYLAALAIDPRHAKSQLNLANVLAREGNYSSAVEHLHIAIRENPDLAPAHATLGFVLRRMNDIDGANEALANAVALDPGRVAPRIEYAAVLEARGNLQAAEAQLTEALKLDPANAVASHALRRIRQQRMSPSSAPSSR